MTGYGEFMIPGFCGFGLHFELDGFRLIYLLIAVLMWGVSGVFSKEYMAHYKNKRRYYLFFWFTFFATVGVFLSADLYTTFIFFEIMSFTSYVWVAFDERKESLRAAETYLAVAVIGGMVMLMGLFLLYHQLGTLEISKLHERVLLKENPRMLYVAGSLLLFGFGAKAGCFPLHIWLPKAHPAAPAPTSALLSGILTKTGIFGIIVVSCRIFMADADWGFLIEILGIVTMLLGAFLALFSVNLKKTLACSSISQIGFILVGVGMYDLLASLGEIPAIAARGAFLHMVNHSLFKLLLFLCAGAVFMNLHQLNLNEIRGFGRNKPVLKFCFLVGALGIAGVPLFSGYVSKTLLHESIVEYQMLLAKEAVSGMFPVMASPVFWKFAEWIFLLSGGLTAAYMTKLYVAIFVEKHPDRQEEFDAMSGSYMKRASAFVLLIPAVLLPVFGSLPSLVMDKIADMGQGFFLIEEMEHPVVYFSLTNLKGSLISLAIGGVLYLVVVRKLLMKDGVYVDCWPVWLDLENLIYRPLLQRFLPNVFGAVCGFIDRYFISTIVNVFLAISAVLCRIQDSLADGLILLARKTSHRQLNEPQMSGKLAKRMESSTFMQIGKMIEDSFSFGLLLFAFGFCLTIGYLLFVLFH